MELVYTTKKYFSEKLNKEKTIKNFYIVNDEMVIPVEIKKVVINGQWVNKNDFYRLEALAKPYKK